VACPPDIGSVKLTRKSYQDAFLLVRRYASMGTSFGPVSASVTSRCSVKRDEWIHLLFGMEASFDRSYAGLGGGVE